MVPKIETGYRVGSLTVGMPVGKNKAGYSIWDCKCGCGNTIALDTRTLQRGTVKDCGCKTKVSPRQKDITGQRFGLLTAVEPLPTEKGRSTVWHCVCDCGGEVDAPLHQLTAGYRRSCGCLSHPGLKDFIGKQFGRLTVIAYAGKKSGMHQWKCRCECGREITVGQTPLQSGTTKSCGCLAREQIPEKLQLVDGTSLTLLKALHEKRLSNNTSGHTGVYLHGKTNKWRAEIQFCGRRRYLGAYDSLEEAVQTRTKAEKMHTECLEKYGML